LKSLTSKSIPSSAFFLLYVLMYTSLDIVWKRLSLVLKIVNLQLLESSFRL
jgi:hypothetical protein